MSTTHDSHLMKMAATEAKQSSTEIPEILDEGLFVVPVRQDQADLSNYTSMVLNSKNPVQLLVPRDPTRKRATVLADNNVILASSSAVAGQATLLATTSTLLGFYLPANTPLQIESVAPVWVAQITVTAPSFPATTVAQANTFPFPVQVVISAGTVTAVAVNGVTVGAGDGTYNVPAFGAITVTYTGSPTWTWNVINGLTHVSVAVEKYENASS